MSARTNAAATFLHEQGYTIIAAEAQSGGGLSSAVGRWGSGGTALILCVLIRGLMTTKKKKVRSAVDDKPFILISLGLLAAAAFTNAAGFWDDIAFIARDLTLSINQLGIGDSTPAAIGFIMFLVLWLFELKLGARVLAGFIAFTVWSAADGSLWQNITNLFNHFSGMNA